MVLTGKVNWCTFLSCETVNETVGTSAAAEVEEAVVVLGSVVVAVVDVVVDVVVVDVVSRLVGAC